MLTDSLGQRIESLFPDYAPAVLVNDKLYKNITREKLHLLLDEWV